MRKLGILLLAAMIVFVLWDYGSEFVAVDRCLDGGGVYDYRESRCRDDVVHLPYLPYTERRSGVIAAGGALTVLSLGLMVFGRRGSR